jgi:hypothetical protein
MNRAMCSGLLIACPFPSKNFAWAAGEFSHSAGVGATRSVSKAGEGMLMKYDRNPDKLGEMYPHLAEEPWLVFSGRQYCR